MATHFQTLMAQLGRTLGLPDLALDDTGYCCLQLDSTSVHLEALEDTHALLLVYSTLGQLADPPPRAVCQQLLQGNHLMSGTAGATLGLGEDGRTVSLSKVVETGALDVMGLEYLLHSFTTAAEHWSAVVQATDADASEHVAPSISAGALPLELHPLLRV